jgi:hypothetical protein
MTLATTDAMVEVCRAAPDRTRVRMKINQNPWELRTGREFLEVWDQPIAGTIYVGCVYLDGEKRLDGLGP